MRSARERPSRAHDVHEAALTLFAERGYSLWFSPEGPISEGELAFRYGDIALRIAGARARREGVER